LGTFTWSENKRSVSSDTPSLLDHADVTNDVEAGETVSIDFAQEPDLIEVGVWEDEEVVFKQLAGNTITLPNDEKSDVLYVIRAEWPEGDALYSLSIKTIGSRP